MQTTIKAIQKELPRLTDITAGCKVQYINKKSNDKCERNGVILFSSLREEDYYIQIMEETPEKYINHTTGIEGALFSGDDLQKDDFVIIGHDVLITDALEFLNKKGKYMLSSNGNLYIINDLMQLSDTGVKVDLSNKFLLGNNDNQLTNYISELIKD